ncbi:MAG TPA: hypothetical protein VFT53_04935 [Candidatus Saccharimonadales bacterium]|nr:hypothetical protein [Candidatus Saccharimonadales bacterium]
MATAAPPDDPHKASATDGLTEERLKALQARYTMAGGDFGHVGDHDDTQGLTPERLMQLQNQYNEEADFGRIGDRDPGISPDEAELNALTGASQVKPTEGAAEASESQSLNQLAPQATQQAADSEQVQPKKKGKLSNRRKAAIGVGILLGGGGAAIIGGYSFLLPLKVTALIERLDSLFQSAPQAAMQKMTDNLINKYIANYVLKGINTGYCTSTVEPTCVGDIGGHGPVSRLYQAWRQNKLENKLAKDYGIVFGKKNGKLYMAMNGEQALTDADLQKVMKGEVSIFDIGKETNVTKAREAFKDATRWWEVDKRYFIGKLLEEKYGIKRCVIACDIRDKFTAAIADKKLAAQAAFVRRVVGLFSEQYSIMFQCLLSPDTGFCSEVLEKIPSLAPGESLDTTNMTPFQKNLSQQMVAYAQDPANDLTDLATAVKNASSIAEKGFAETIVEKVLTAVFGENIGKLGTKAVPIVGWVLLAAQVISLADKLGPMVRWMGYAINAAAAVNMYMTYSTVSSETKSGHMDSVELGSFVQSLTTNMSGSANNQVDATATPLYGALLGGGAPGASNYTCNDGSSVQNGQVVCPEEKLDRGNGITDAITNIVNFVPGLTGLAHIINWVNDLIGSITGAVMEGACNTVLNIPPNSPGSCPNVVKQAGQYVGQFVNWFIGVLLPSPFSQDMSGGRSFDMITAGADVAANKTCQVQLGCAKLTNQQIADIRSTAAAEDQAMFDRQPIFARMFSTTSPYSLVSRLAVAMPGTMPQAAIRLGALIDNPIKTLASAFGNVFATNKAFAAPGPMDDPFGVVQYGYMPNQIPNDPETYYNTHCTDQTNVDWMTSLPQDPNTGEPLATTTNACLLIESAQQAAGSMFDSSLAPQGAINPDPTN